MARPNTSSFEVLILQAGGVTSPAVLQALRDKRFAPRLASDPQALEGLVKKMVDPILVLEAGDDTTKTRELLTRLEPLGRVHKVPIVLTGGNVEQFEKGLDQVFPAATTLNTPYGAVEMLAAINYLARTVVQRRGQQEGKQATEAPRTSQPSAAAPMRARQPQPLPGYPVPEMVFTQLQKLGLLGRSIGGEPLSGNGIDLDLMRSMDMMPKNPDVKMAVDAMLIDAAPWAKSHLLRVSFVSQRIVAPLNPEAPLSEAVKSSSFLYAWSFFKDRPDLLQSVVGTGGVMRKDSEAEDQGGLRIELASKIKDSALAVMQEFGLERESKIISTVARLIGGEVKPADDDLSVVASAVMAADTADRICYANGSWNPRRAYSFLNRLKAGDAVDVHPTVVCCMVKLLAEAIAARTPVYLLPKELRRNKELRDELMQQARRPVATHEKKVPLAALAPGMTLSQALIGMDGKEVLAPDIQLDQDLIWRIWQLSAVRPLRSVIVHRPTNIPEEP